MSIDDEAGRAAIEAIVARAPRMIPEQADKLRRLFAYGPPPTPTGEPPTPDPVKSMAGKIGAHISWANTPDRSARTKPARDALFAKLLAEADGDPQRAKHLWKAHFTRLALKSAQSRRKRR
jgi:hypothetical protein